MPPSQPAANLITKYSSKQAFSFTNRRILEDWLSGLLQFRSVAQQYISVYAFLKSQNIHSFGYSFDAAPVQPQAHHTSPLPGAQFPLVQFDFPQGVASAESLCDWAGEDRVARQEPVRADFQRDQTWLDGQDVESLGAVRRS